VLALFAGTIYFGELFGLLSAFIGENYSWRTAFFALGIPGFFVAVVLGLTVKEPERGMSEKSSNQVISAVKHHGGILQRFLLLIKLPGNYFITKMKFQIIKFLKCKFLK
jgi:predicted MFS family arabinose efflux permease